MTRYRNDDPFLDSWEWRTVRMRVLERDGAKCACCGETAADGAVMNVDHIKSRRKYPELALTESNLQVLCAACNHGKGNRYETDWRRNPMVPNVRRPPSLARELMQGLLLVPSLAKTLTFPRPEDGSHDSECLIALINYCAAAEGELSSASILEHFAQSPYEGVLANVLARAEDSGLTLELAEAHVREGLDYWWEQLARKYGVASTKSATQTADEISRLRQLDHVRRMCLR